MNFGKDDLVPHFIYCGMHHEWLKEIFLHEMLLMKMKSYGLQFAILTELEMYRLQLVTKETVKKAYKGELKNDKDWKYYDESIHDDLEKVFIDLQDGKKITNEEVFSFFTPKLTEEELKLVEERNEQQLSTYSRHYFGNDPDVDAEEMKKSDSKSKYVHVHCYRATMPLALESSPKEPIDDNISKTKKKCVLL